MILDAILKINPNASCTVKDDDIDSIEWHAGTDPIAREDIEAQFPIVEFDLSIQSLRIKRNKLLSETDYLALSDNTMSEEMTTYRQELWDITEGLTTVEEVEAVEFPTKP